MNLQAIEHVTHYGDRLYRVRLRERVGTEITASARLAAFFSEKFGVRNVGPMLSS